ncbi:MAG TPA: trypsin-like peptidase domain-containing protein, partial [Vicinamibacterales bacterium]|nr:trypsin-like peptidase domain-containing protein [Vicinamibacterales bacterium]
MFSRHLVAAAASIAVLGAFNGSIHALQERIDPTKEHLDSTGSGFILTSSGYIVTNHHVIAGATLLGVQIPGREKAVPAKVVVDDPEDDLAIVKIDGPLGNSPIAFADAAQVRMGQDIVALGYPLGFELGQTVRTATGTISSLLGPRDKEGLYQVSAPVQHGNSGGPVFNKDGQLVGVVVSGFTRAQNVNFVIKGSVL